MLGFSSSSQGSSSLVTPFPLAVNPKAECFSYAFGTPKYPAPLSPITAPRQPLGSFQARYSRPILLLNSFSRSWQHLLLSLWQGISGPEELLCSQGFFCPSCGQVNQGNLDRDLQTCPQVQSIGKRCTEPFTSGGNQRETHAEICPEARERTVTSVFWSVFGVEIWITKGCCSHQFPLSHGKGTGVNRPLVREESSNHVIHQVT